MPRPKRLRPDAEQVGFYLTPEEQLVLQIIRVRRKKRGDVRIGQSEIVSDALMALLETVEGVAKERIEELVADHRPTSSKLKHFPRK
jgi:hypothetical protein